jgi:hypothetical protein
MMRRFVRTATAAVLALGMMGSAAAVAAPVPDGSTSEGTVEGAGTVTTAAYPWICRIFPDLPYC